MINDEIIGSALSAGEISLEKFDTSTVSFYASLNTLKAIELASKKKDTINLRLKGEVTAFPVRHGLFIFYKHFCIGAESFRYWLVNKIHRQRLITGIG